MPSGGGQFHLEGGSMTAYNVQRSAAGLYVCSADNGVGEPVSRTVTVNVRCQLIHTLSHTHCCSYVPLIGRIASTAARYGRLIQMS